MSLLDLSLSNCRNQKVLFTVLNWGLGHAARSVPIIQQLLAQGNEVTVASDGAALQLLEQELEETVRFEVLPSLEVHYKYNNMGLNMFLQGGKLLRWYFRELKAVKSLVRKSAIDVVITDNRFGSRASGVKNVFITHQLKILAKQKVSSWMATKLNLYFVQQFDACWVPDVDGSILSGALSNKEISIPKYYIGAQSRLTVSKSHKKYDYLVLLSGPEPARTKLEESLNEVLSDSGKIIAWVRGTKVGSVLPSVNGITVFDFVDSAQLSVLCGQSEQVICRSGYSSLMDLEVVGLPALLIPTPGQPEQIYLAQQMSKRSQYDYIEESAIQTYFHKKRS